MRLLRSKHKHSEDYGICDQQILDYQKSIINYKNTRFFAPFYCGVKFFGFASFLPFLFLKLNELQYYRKKVHTFFAVWGSIAFASFMLLGEGNQASPSFIFIWLTAGFCFTILGLNSAVFLKTRSV
jgi:hypothetical protein